MFHLPPKVHNPDGSIRKAGFEIEYTGLEPSQTAEIVQNLFGGQMERINSIETKVTHSKYGDFSIYLDSIYLRKLDEFELTKEFDFVKDMLTSVSELIVPYEIVTPPIPFDHLDSIEELRMALKNAGALGTSASLLYAFGMHINIETFSFKTRDILNILRSFVLLQDYISETIDVDLTRKLTWFIEPFEKEYVDLILNKSYNPNFEEFANDYIYYNPTRNRALDLLPLLCHVQPSLAKNLPKQKLSPRPAFHYRLPNSKIDEENWSISFEFNQWSLVERIATNQTLLFDLIDEYWEYQNSPFWFIKELWVERVKEWIKESL